MNGILLEAAQSGGEGQAILAYLLFFAGLAMVITEFFLPGFIMGLIGVCAVVAGVVLAFKVSSTAGTILLIVALVSLPVFLIAWLKIIGPAMALTGEVPNDDEGRASLHALRGQEGVAISKLRPAGVARFGERRVDVVTDGEIIDADTRVKAVEIRGNQVIVRPVRM